MMDAQALAALQAAIIRLLNLPAAQQLLRPNSNTCERAYEAYVFSLCCEAVRRAGGTVQLTGIRSGSQPNPVVFRGAPGSMASECKFYESTPSVMLGRTFVGLISDCGGLRLEASSLTSLLPGLRSTFRSVRAPSHF